MRAGDRLVLFPTLRYPTSVFSTLRIPKAPSFWYRAGLVIATGLFINSILTGGLVWDEPNEFDKLAFQLSFARDVLAGSTDRTFRAFPFDWAFYGVGSALPAYALSYLIDGWLTRVPHTFDHSYSLLLHVISFLCMIAGVSYTRRLVYLATGERETAFLAGIVLLVTPFWVGYGFFDYKDMPVAAGIVAATYYAARYMQDARSSTSCSFFFALLFLGVQKLAVIPLAMPACVAVLYAAARKPSPRRLAILALQAALFLFVLYVATPPAWQEPFAFVTTSITYMSQHTLGGCTLTAGQCIGRDFDGGNGYSAIKYLGLWYAVQFPLLLAIGLLASICLYVKSFRQARPCQHLLMAAVVWPIAAVSLRNSTLYDGIRHTLFLMPLVVALVFITIPGSFWWKGRWWLACYFVFLLVDAMRLQPYQYVWFNEPARFFASEKNYETDYWGYSMRQVAIRARDLQGPTDWVVSPKYHLNPSHLVRIFISERFSRELSSVPLGATYFLVSSTRQNAQAPKECGNAEYVSRHQLLAPGPLHFAFLAKCRKE